jgi:hypothetical protein
MKGPSWLEGDFLRRKPKNIIEHIIDPSSASLLQVGQPSQ